tara:strand:- start:106 stop:354 length:249 start_codon:yes stop_codon:yes gene_type:complete
MDEETRSAEQLAQDYTAMGHSVDLINGIIDGSQMADESDEDKQDAVKRNKEHLELMIAKEDWGSEDMSDAEDAISDAETYLG